MSFFLNTPINIDNVQSREEEETAEEQQRRQEEVEASLFLDFLIANSNFSDQCLFSK